MLLAAERREKILEMLREDGHVKVSELSKVFGISEVTIRQDLEKLEEEQQLRRVHGGAILNNAGNNVREFSLVTRDHQDAKQAIAREAVKLIKNGDTIILDSGSTTTEIAHLIMGFTNLTVITNALNIAMILGSNPGINLLVTGGEFKSPTLSLTGQKAADFFVNLHADKVFLATAGINIETGLTYPSVSDLVVKKAMIDASEHVYLVADSSKIGKSAFACLGSLSLVDTIITDDAMTLKDQDLLLRQNIDIVIAK
ncbi:DeoR/GlpR family DNA-binding transcription regulator [Segatella bryantii]|jgi:DeoR/GlpR family transcriptional regulator of sugar metabolism|uniref:DeoR/GlpR family DNA-binding transcription regulator n=1 Tax=Segatella bryantii TaxID=77095 RepID=UPI0024327CE8|nr:DeoR/GlpR family DNA-binding transcription regulator [Segatella bryantii]